MKMSKFRLAFLVLLAVTMIYSVAFYWSFQTYNTWRQERIKQIPEEMKPWIDIVPFWGTSTAQTFGIGVYVLILPWIALLLVGDKLDKNKVVAVAIIGLTLMIGIPRVQAANKIYIDVLVAHDEEVTDEWLLDIVLDDPNYINTKWTYNRWFNVVLEFHKYVLWDSDDSNNDLIALLDEAIEDIGWYWNMTYEGETMELMMVFTGQNDPEMNGYSPPWKRAMICEMGDLSFTIMHELGHQFGCGHCSDLWCYMNPDTPFAVGGYCSYHQEVIMANRECLLETPPPSPDSSPVSWFWGGGATGGRRK